MNLTPEMKQQLEEQKKQCIFCKLISGEMEAKTTFQDSVTVSMLDIYPAVKGHCTFMPKEHYPIMPYMPADEFKHYFSIIPDLCKAIQSGAVMTGVNIFIANGGPAGQTAPHFLSHILPREKGDGFFNFMFDKRSSTLEGEAKQKISQIFPMMMQKHFQRNPFSWHSGSGDRPAHLLDISGEVIYEDEKLLVRIPEKGITATHLEIYSKEEEKDITNLSQESSFHLFSTASLLATAVFENAGVHATNIIVKSGEADDNQDGTLSVHILGRMQDDDLKYLHWEPKQPSYDLDSVMSKIKDKTWKVNYGSKKKEEKKVEVIEPQVMKIGKRSAPTKMSAQEEIRRAIQRHHS